MNADLELILWIAAALVAGYVLAKRQACAECSSSSSRSGIPVNVNTDWQ